MDDLTALICVDGSKHSDRAFEWYLKHMHSEGTTLGFVHIHQMPNLPIGLYEDGFVLDSAYQHALQDSIEESKKIINKYKELCIKHKVEYTSFLKPCLYSIGESICKVANEIKAGCIVIGQRGLGVVRRTLMGSVSDYILHHSNIPVIVIPAADQ